MRYDSEMRMFITLELRSYHSAEPNPTKLLTHSVNDTKSTPSMNSAGARIHVIWQALVRLLSYAIHVSTGEERAARHAEPKLLRHRPTTHLPFAHSDVERRRPKKRRRQPTLSAKQVNWTEHWWKSIISWMEWVALGCKVNEISLAYRTEKKWNFSILGIECLMCVIQRRPKLCFLDVLKKKHFSRLQFSHSLFSLCWRNGEIRYFWAFFLHTTEMRQALKPILCESLATSIEIWFVFLLSRIGLQIQSNISRCE